MNKIDKSTTLEELAFIICGTLRENKIDAVLTGGAVVSIYSNNIYQSYDLDFITHHSTKDVAEFLKKIGFTKEGRYYKSESTDYFIEFPPPPVAIGNKPIKEFNEIKKDFGYLKLLTPTQCVMDRLAAYFYWNDHQSLDQALLVAQKNIINFEEIRLWAKEEGSLDKFIKFLDYLEKNNSV